MAGLRAPVGRMETTIHTRGKPQIHVKSNLLVLEPFPTGGLWAPWLTKLKKRLHLAANTGYDNTSIRYVESIRYIMNARPPNRNCL